MRVDELLQEINERCESWNSANPDASDADAKIQFIQTFRSVVGPVVMDNPTILPIQMMSFREYAAVAAMQGMFAGDVDADTANVVVWAVNAADMLIDELKRKDGGNLRDVLASLVAHQNGCPLPKYEKGWNEAMAKANALLREHQVSSES